MQSSLSSSIMNMIMSKLKRCVRIRQLHTIISQETIKPSFPTPSHLKTYNLSLLDRVAPNIHSPLVFFYKNYNKSDINILKKSLSLSLTQYYPLAGKLLEPSAPYIECNDEGVEFLEASNDSQIDDFVLKKDQDETLDQLFPNGLGCDVHRTVPDLVRVQVNHFACGGVAVAVSISHKFGDAFTVANFINHWATVACGRSPINPSFLSSSRSDIKVPEITYNATDNVNYVTKSFVFPNSKLTKLKKKVCASSTNQFNPTRVEMLTSLLFKCFVDSASTISGFLHPSDLYQVVGMRKKILNGCSETTVGNICSILISKMGDSCDINLNEVIANLRRERMEIKDVRDVEEVGKMLGNTLSKLSDDNRRIYRFSSTCRFPFYEVDFGWGKPERVIIRLPNLNQNFTILMDAPHGDGIEAIVQLEKQEMAIFEKDKELLAYVEDN